MVSPDGKAVVFNELAPGRLGESRDIWMLPFGGEPTPLLTASFNERGAAFSPDGRILAYVSDESGQDEVFITPIPGPGAKLAVSASGGLQPVWSRDGSELFYRERNQLMAVRVDREPFSASAPEALFDVSETNNDLNFPSYDVSPDGRFLFAQRNNVVREFRIVLNWFEELERLVPTEE